MTGISMAKRPAWGAGSAKSAVPVMPKRHIHFLMSKSFPDAYSVPGENWDPTHGWDDGMGAGGYADMNPQNSYWEWKLGLLMAGTWQICTWGVHDANRGIATFQMNGVTVATIDMYTAANDYPGSFMAANFVIASDREVVWRVTNPTKRAAATGYQISLRIMALDRISA